MPLDLLDLSTQVRQMGELLAHRREDEQRRLRLLDAMLADYRDRWEELADLASSMQDPNVSVQIFDTSIVGGQHPRRKVVEIQHDHERRLAQAVACIDGGARFQRALQGGGVGSACRHEEPRAGGEVLVGGMQRYRHARGRAAGHDETP